jgi:hypothetical protein
MHLILLSINEVNKDLSGFVIIYSDCLGTLDKVKNLPLSCIPTRSAHLDVLKNIPVNCSNISFNRYYFHVLAHQDDQQDNRFISCPSQLNCFIDYLAKKALWDFQATQPPPQQAFPLEPICIFASNTKITADMGNYVQFWTQRQLAHNSLHHLNILFAQECGYVDWEMVYEILHGIPRLFQLWACKQVMGIAGTMEWDRTVMRTCPSCMVRQDTCAHVLFCCHSGRV